MVTLAPDDADKVEEFEAAGSRNLAESHTKEVFEFEANNQTPEMDQEHPFVPNGQAKLADRDEDVNDFMPGTAKQPISVVGI